MSILVLGTVALDDVKTPFGSRQGMLGGSASHFSMSARLFTEVHLAAVIGEDFPSGHIAFLHKKGIILDSLARERGRTFRWEGEYRGDLNTALTRKTELGVLASFKACISRQEAAIPNVFLANIDPDVQRDLLCRMRNPRLVGLDSMNYWIRHKRASLLRLLKKVDIFVANDQEARDLSGEQNLLRAARRLQGMGAKTVLLKKGEHGVLFCAKGFVFSIPAYPIEKVIDPTGAGDTFAGAFMGYLSKFGKISPARIRKAIAYATVAASFNVEGFGLERTARLTMRDLQTRMRHFRRIISF